MNPNQRKKLLILSQGPVPTPEHKKVEGGGLRCWGLAKGIVANKAEIDVTVAYHESYKQTPFTKNYEGISLTTWNIDSIGELLGGFDSILVSYCMADLSVKVADLVRTDQQLVLDCYVPIYVEVSARNTDDLEGEYAAFHHDVGRWAHVLRRGDMFLVASSAQLRFYKGVLSALGRVNPVTYGEDLIKIVPYGIYREEPSPKEKPITKLIGKDTTFKKVLWFGGIYPWFDLRNLVDAVHLLNKTVPAKLVIVGAKNPFNDHPDFTRPYDQLIEHIETNHLQDSVIMKDWIQFQDRADWYADSDVVVVINKLGEENELAWRTRLVDFMWADLPIVTNGGDPLGELLLEHDAATRFNGLDAEAMSKDLQTILKDTEKLQNVRANLKKLKKQFYWDTVTKQLSRDIESKLRARDLEEYGNLSVVQGPPSGKRAMARLAIRKARMVPAYARKYGLRNTYYASRTKALNQLKKVGLSVSREPRVIMIAHQLDLSGAPFVFIDLAEAIKHDPSSPPIDFHTFNPTHRDNIVRLNKVGIKPNIHISKDIGMQFVPGDVVVLNTVAHTTPLKESIYAALEANEVSELIWFIHEDDPQQLFNKAEVKRLKTLLAKNKVVIYIAANKALHNYQQLFENEKNIRKQPYKYLIPKRFQKVRDAQDFDTLHFLLTGTVTDGRKGQLPILYAFHAFKQQYYDRSPKSYRNFDLSYVGMAQDFVSTQIREHAPKLLGDRFIAHPNVSHERSSELMMEANVTICYSLRECLPLFVFEGMAAGHPVMRNDSSGMEEQLIVGKNGFFLPSDDFDQVVVELETILNLEKTPAATLAAMSKESNRIALAQADNTYDPMVAQITKSFGRKA